MLYLTSLADKILLTVRTDVWKYSVRGAVVPAQSVDVVVSKVVVDIDRIPVAVDEPVVHVVPAADREYKCTVHKTGLYLWSLLMPLLIKLLLLPRTGRGENMDGS